MLDRYFVESPILGDQAVLVGAEAHHLLHVMRAKPGARVTLFDGTGWEFDAIVARPTRRDVELTIVSRQAINREATTVLTLGVALPKGDRQKWLVEKAVELGVVRLVPLQTDRGVAQPAKNSLERLRRGVIEASKQCGRNRLMAIAQPKTWHEFLLDGESQMCRLVAHPSRDLNREPERLILKLAARLPAPPQIIAVAVGPEGGFTEEEVEMAVAHDWLVTDLGVRILRVETAAIALAAMLIGSER
jgi:16S rRNA (uracil1498-N3)-methyltransferase